MCLEMSKKITVICVEGSGSSSRDESSTISNGLRKALEGHRYVASFEVHEFNPVWWWIKRKKIGRILKKTKHTDGILFVGKSLGAYRLIKCIDDMKWITRFSRSALVTIDPYAPFGKCGQHNSVDVPEFVDWSRNVFQIDSYPGGAVVVGAKNIQEFGVDHMSIVNTKSVMAAYIDAIVSLVR